MKTVIKTRILSILLILCILLSLTACKEKKEKEPEAEVYYTAISVQYSPEGQYSGTLTFDEGIEDSFTELSKEDFVLTAFYSVDEGKFSSQLEDFTVTKTGDKSLTFTFKSPYGYDDNISYVLMSETAVTAKEKKIAAVVYTHAPEVDLNIEYIGLYKGTDKATVTAMLGEGWKFVEKMTSDMLTFPIGLDVSVEVRRESDTKAVFVITDIPKNYTGAVISGVLSASAVDSEFSEDTDLCLDFLQPNIYIDPSTVSFDKNTNVFAVGKATLSEEFAGVKDGISVWSGLYSVIEQSYDSGNNAYSFKLKINDKLDKGLDVNDVLTGITVNAVLKTESEEINYAFRPYNAIAGVKGDVITDTEKGKVYIEIVPYNATFKEGISVNDITVFGAGSLSSFVCSSVASDKIVYTADYSSKLKSGVALSFNMAGRVLNTDFGLDSYSLTVPVPPYYDDKDFSWGELGVTLAKSAAGSLGGAIGSAVAGFVLPHVYELLGVDTSNPELNAIRNSIDRLDKAIVNLNNDIRKVRVDVQVGTSMTALSELQSLQNNLLTDSRTLLGKETVINYVRDVSKAAQVHSAWNYDKFCEYLAEEYGSIERARYKWTADMGTDKDLTEIYDILVSFANYTNLSFSDYMDRAHNRIWGIGFSFKDMDEYQYYLGRLGEDAAKMYRCMEALREKLKGAPYYGRKVKNVEIDPILTEGFINEVKELNIGNGYLQKVINLSSLILETASGTGDSIIDLFFQVVDTQFNFESQTINIKKAFLAKLQSTYLISSAIALQYCDATNDGNASTIRSYIPIVMEKIDNAFNKIDIMTALADKGADRLLVSGQVVSKKMKKATGTKGAKSDTSIRNDIREGFLSVSDQTYTTMIERAQNRGLSLAADLQAAGFVDVVPDEGITYIYMTGNATYYNTLTVGDLFVLSMKLAVTSSTDSDGGFKVTTVTQNGTGNPSVEENNVIQVDYSKTPVVWAMAFGGAEGEYYTVPSYNAVIGFVSGE
jgi:hypothetical protein